MIQRTQKQETRKISINFPSGLWKELKLKALQEDTTVTEVLVRLTKEYLARPNEKRRS
jgi:macrodomain Ter protein organizer (MatP/YcbG family)